MGHTLVEIHHDSEASAKAMESLAAIAEAQNRLALEGRAVASAFIL